MDTTDIGDQTDDELSNMSRVLSPDVTHGSHVLSSTPLPGNF